MNLVNKNYVFSKINCTCLIEKSNHILKTGEQLSSSGKIVYSQLIDKKSKLLLPTKPITLSWLQHQKK